jgi:tripartite motif-containing protein 71
MGWPAANYKRAGISYVDREMRVVNTVAPNGGISTTEYNTENEVKRTLSAENRAAAIKETNPAAASELLDTQSTYNEEGELTATLGPQHTVKLAKGKTEPNETVLARNHVKYFYDEGAPKNEESYELVTKTEDGAETASHEEFDVRTARTAYSGQGGIGWKLRKPTSTTTDPAGLDITQSTEYNETTGDVTQTKSPGATSELVYPPVFYTSFGSAGSEPGKLSNPDGVAIDSSGNEWVLDRGNDRVEKFSSSGTFIAAYGKKGTGNEEFLEPWDLAINQSTGNVYVTDTGNRRIEELNSSGKFVAAFGWGVNSAGGSEFQKCTTACKAGLSGSGAGEFAEAFGVTVDASSGNVFVTDAVNDRIEEISAEGAYVTQFGSTGAGNGEFNEPADLTVAEGELYVSDYANNRVEEITETGSYLGQIGSKGKAAGQMEGPFGIAANPTTGDLFVADSKNNRIEEFTPAGKFLAEFGSPGVGKGQFNVPAGLAINSSGVLYIPDFYNNRIEEWHPPQAGGAHLLYSTQFGSAGSEHGQFNYPGVPAIDGHGNVWATDYGNNRIQEFTAAGVFIATYGSAGITEGKFEGPTGIAVNQASGNVYVGDCNNNRIDELSSTGTPIRSIGTTEPGKLHCPGGVKIDSSGNIWVADTENNRIVEFSATGTYIAAYGTLGSGNKQFKKPEDLAFSGGNLYVADAGNNRVEELSSTGTYLGQFGYEGSGSGQLKTPEGIASDAAGNLYVLDRGNSRIEEFSSSGSFLASFGTSGTGEGQLNGPQGLALDPAGDLYVADGYNNRIEKWENANQAVHDTKTIYYSPGTEAPVEGCQNHPEWVGLPCQTEPVAQPGEGMPNLPITHIEYNTWEQPETITETFGTGSSKVERKKKTSFDEAGRPLSTEETSSIDQALPKITDTYNKTNGSLETQSTTVGGTTKTITSVDNLLGELENYTDADGNVAKYTLDIDGRVTKIVDGSEEASKKYGYEGWQEYQYDETTGYLTKLTDSAAGVFTANWTIGGHLGKETYPNGMAALYTINPAGQDTGIEYKKETHCTEKCVWLSDTITPSIHGETLTQTSSLAKDADSFDPAGRLTQVEETPAGEGCKTRLYHLEEEGNRTSLTQREPTSEGKCASEGGAVERHTYSAANQLNDPGVTYEELGNTTTLPATDAGEAALTSSYYVDNQIYKQTQSGTGITYLTDPEDRTRETTAVSGAENTKNVNHYDGPGSTLAWTVEPKAGAWTRDIPGIGGELTAIQTNTKTVLLIHDLQGNVVAEASTSETATALLKTYNSTEYGVPSKKGAPPKYAWLGASGLSSELSSGTITQDGVTYVPQTGRPLQTEQVELPEPILYVNPYVREDPGGEWDAISSAKQVAAYWEVRRAQEAAAAPPGVVPASGCDEEVEGCGPDPEHGDNLAGCKVFGSWSSKTHAEFGSPTAYGHAKCTGYSAGFELKVAVQLVQSGGLLGGSYVSIAKGKRYWKNLHGEKVMEVHFFCERGKNYRMWIYGRGYIPGQLGSFWTAEALDGRLWTCPGHIEDPGSSPGDTEEGMYGDGPEEDN